MWPMGWWRSPATGPMAAGMGRSRVKPYRPASRLPKGRNEPNCHPKPALTWQLIEEARTAGIPFRLVVADAISGEHAELEGTLFGVPDLRCHGPHARAQHLAARRGS
jgi:hypothetical protein